MISTMFTCIRLLSCMNKQVPSQTGRPSESRHNHMNGASLLYEYSHVQSYLKTSNASHNVHLHSVSLFSRYMLVTLQV